VAVLRANIVRVTHALQWLGAEQINAEGDAGPAALDTVVEDKEEVVEDAPAVQAQEGSFVNRRGRSIFCRQWSVGRGSERLGFVLITHGYGEHCGRYQWVAEQLVAAGYDVFALDLTGHGRSAEMTRGGFGGDIESWEALVDDAEDFFRYTCILDGLEDAPFYLLGHSMGGAITFQLAKRLQAVPGLMCDGRSPKYYKEGEAMPRGRGVIISAAAFRVYGNILSPAPYNAFFRGLTRAMASAFPKMESPGVAKEKLTNSAEVNDAAEADPLNFGNVITTHMGNEMVKLGIATTDEAPTFRPSLLLLHGEADKVTKVEGTRLIYKTVPSIDKRLCLYPGLKHEILLEPGLGGRKDVMADVLSWMEGRMTIFRLMML